MFKSNERTGRYNNHNEKDNDANNDADLHLHVFPPHHPSRVAGTSSEIACRAGQRIGFVLYRIDVFTTLIKIVHVFSHGVNCFVNLLLRVIVSTISEH